MNNIIEFIKEEFTLMGLAWALIILSAIVAFVFALDKVYS